MKNRYEALIVLNVKGGDDSIKEAIDRLEAGFKAEGATVEAIQKMDRRPLAYVTRKVETGYYVNFVFEAEPTAIEKLRARFKLDKEVYLQYYQKLSAKKAAA